MKAMMQESPWSNHLKIAIRCWSLERARQMAENAIRVPPELSSMEQFLAELLTNALLEFNETYNKASNEQIESLMRMTEDALALKPRLQIQVDNSVPPNEIRFVSWHRNESTGEYEPRVDRIINIGSAESAETPK